MQSKNDSLSGISLDSLEMATRQDLLEAWRKLISCKRKAVQKTSSTGRAVSLISHRPLMAALSPCCPS